MHGEFGADPNQGITGLDISLKVSTELELSGFSQEVCGRRVVVTVAAGGAIAVL